jgi:molybdopterin-guanine dinucleotide biosynthesis protein A
MGLDKAILRLGSERMLDRQVRLLRSVCRSVSIIGPPNRFAGAGIRVYGDDIPGRGPLGGIYTGLRRARTEFSLFLSCDMPFVQARFLRYLCQQALARRAQVTLPPPWTTRRYPLCAILCRDVLPVLRSTLALEENRVSQFFLRVKLHIISKAEFAHAGFSPRMFCNVNTRAEYEKARQQFENLISASALSREAERVPRLRWTSGSN